MRLPSLSVLLAPFALVYVSSAASVAHAKTLVEQRYDLLYRYENKTVSLRRPSVRRAAMISAKYRYLFDNLQKPAVVQTVADNALHLLFRAARTAEFYEPSNQKYFADLMMDLDELKHRGIATAQEYTRAYGAMIAAREFDKARALRAEHPDLHLPKVPRYRDNLGVAASGPTKLVVAKHDYRLTRVRAHLDIAARILVIANPLCHFVQSGYRNLQSDPMLREAFANHATWLAPVDQQLHFREIQRWNEKHPEAAIAIAYRENEWTMLDTWDLPTFYFFKEGRLVTRFTGWRPQQARAALQQIGLLPIEPVGHTPHQ